MNVHNGHRARLKDRFLSCGLDAFQEHEMLELLLIFAIPQVDVNPLAHKLINAFGSLAGVLNAPFCELVNIEGIGTHSATLIHLMPQLCRKYLTEHSLETILDSSEKTGNYLLPRFIGLNVETVFLVSLDSKSMVLGTDLIHSGSIHTAEASSRKIVQTALRHNATSVVLAHNHPGGIATPSQQDLASTRAIKSALLAVEVLMLDHIIIAGNDFVSLADSGFFI